MKNVLLRRRSDAARYRAFAMTYLHVQWLDAAFRHVQVVSETNRFRVYRALR